MKVMTVVGTRPEIIRLSRVVARLDDTPGVRHVLVHTGQNYDPLLSQIFFDEMQIREPDRFLGVDTSSLGAVLGGVLMQVEKALKDEKPDAVLVLGDTNSAIAALMAKRMHIPTYHMEAGNRSWDENVPEETNRRLVDHVVDFNLAYTELARQNLLREGLHPRRIVVTGSPMREVLEFYRPIIDRSGALAKQKLEAGGYFLVSAHRQENVDDPVRLRSLVQSLESVHQAWGLPVIVSTHPRTRRELVTSEVAASAGIRWVDPFGFADYNHLQQHAACVLSDSGTISEEAAILGFPAVTIRDSMERPEALDAGSIVMCGLQPTDVVQAVETVMSARGPRHVPAGYDVPDTSSRVVRFMLSTAARHHDWAGIRRAFS